MPYKILDAVAPKITKNPRQPPNKSNANNSLIIISPGFLKEKMPNLL